jgi:hypothetical protein
MSVSFDTADITTVVTVNADRSDLADMDSFARQYVQAFNGLPVQSDGGHSVLARTGEFYGTSHALIRANSYDAVGATYAVVSEYVIHSYLHYAIRTWSKCESAAIAFGYLADIR